MSQVEGAQGKEKIKRERDENAQASTDQGREVLAGQRILSSTRNAVNQLQGPACWESDFSRWTWEPLQALQPRSDRCRSVLWENESVNGSGKTLGGGENRSS